MGRAAARILPAIAGLSALVLPAAAAAHCGYTRPTEKLSGSGLRLTPIATLGQTTSFATAPGQPKRLYVTQRDGEVTVIEHGKPLRNFLDLSPEIKPGIDPEVNERGMQSLAFAPDYRRSRRLYVFYTDAQADSRVDEFRATPNFSHADPATRRHILFVEHSFEPTHYGGQIAFGPKGRLFVSLGDARRAIWAQQPGLYGRIVSLKPRRPKKTRRLIANGLRNPYRFTFDPFGGALVVGDVGEDGREEIDVIPRKRWGKANGGWPYREGDRAAFPGPLPKYYLKPVYTYIHRDAGGLVGKAIVGGKIVLDKRLPKLRGRYLYGDLCFGWLALAKLHHKKVTSKHSGLVVSFPTAFGEDARHRLYVAATAPILRGQIFRLDPAKPSSKP